MLQAIGYIRVSSEEQSDSALSLEAQTASISAYCQFKGLNLLKVISDEAVSGGKPILHRPGGSELIDTCKSGEVNAVIATKLDRMFRDALDCLQMNDVLTSHDVALHLLDLNVDTSNAMGKAFLTIAAAFAELELNRGKERTRDALAALKKRGVNLGAVPYGKETVNESDQRTFCPSSYEEAAINLMRELRSKGATYQDIADALNEAGVPTKRNAGNWLRGTVHRILRRERMGKDG